MLVQNAALQTFVFLIAYLKILSKSKRIPMQSLTMITNQTVPFALSLFRLLLTCHLKPTPAEILPLVHPYHPAERPTLQLHHPMPRNARVFPTCFKQFESKGQSHSWLVSCSPTFAILRLFYPILSLLGSIRPSKILIRIRKQMQLSDSCRCKYHKFAI